MIGARGSTPSYRSRYSPGELCRERRPPGNRRNPRKCRVGYALVICTGQRIPRGRYDVQSPSRRVRPAEIAGLAASKRSVCAWRLDSGADSERGRYPLDYDLAGAASRTVGQRLALQNDGHRTARETLRYATRIFHTRAWSIHTPSLRATLSVEGLGAPQAKSLWRGCPTGGVSVRIWKCVTMRSLRRVTRRFLAWHGSPDRVSATTGRETRAL